MNIESINPSTWTWLDFLPAAVLVADIAAVVLAVLAGRKKTAIGLGAVFLAAFVGSCIAVSGVENDTRAENQAVVISYFEKSYGLTLEATDLYSLNHADEKDIVRSVRATDGNLKHVLFRVVDGNVVPHLLDSASTWIPMNEGP